MKTKTTKSTVNEVSNIVPSKGKRGKKVQLSDDLSNSSEKQIVPISHYQFKFEEEKTDLTYSNNIEVKKEKKSRRINYDIPDYGTQSRKIYDYIEIHLFDKNFTVYRVCKVLDTPSNNTRRIYLKFFAQKRDEFLLMNHLQEMDEKVKEPVLAF